MQHPHLGNIITTNQNKLEGKLNFGSTKIGKKQLTIASLDQIDLKLISILQENCQISCRKLGILVGLSGVVVANRIKSLEEKGIIKGYSVILDPVKLGYDLTAIIYIQTEGGFVDAVELEIARVANVIVVYEVTGDFDVIAVAKLKDRESLNTLIKNLLIASHIKRTLTNITLNVMKEDFKLPL